MKGKKDDSSFPLHSHILRQILWRNEETWIDLFNLAMLRERFFHENIRMLETKKMDACIALCRKYV